MVKIPVEMVGFREVGNLVADPMEQPVAQVPAGSTHSFRRTTDQVLLLFHIQGKRSYLYVLRVPFTIKKTSLFPGEFSGIIKKPKIPGIFTITTPFRFIHLIEREPQLGSYR